MMRCVDAVKPIPFVPCKEAQQNMRDDRSGRGLVVRNRQSQPFYLLTVTQCVASYGVDLGRSTVRRITVAR
jgi:hypothetical protein